MKRLFSKRRKTTENSSSRANELTRDEKSRLNKFLARKHIGTRFYDSRAVDHLGLKEEVERLFNNTGIGGLLRIHEYTIPQLTSEFLATFKASLRKEGLKFEGELTFSLGGQRCSMTLTEWNGALGLPVDQEYLSASDAILKEFWREISGLDTLRWKDCPASSIYHPVFKIIQKILGNTIFGRVECSKMRKDEFRCLYCMVQGRVFDLGVELVLKLQDIAGSSSGNIVIGGMITHIAKALDVSFRGLDTLEPKRIDIVHLRTIKLITEDHNGFYHNKLPFGKSAPINARLIDTSHKPNWYRNWLSDNEEDEDEDDEEDDEEEESEDDEDDEEDEEVESETSFDRRGIDMDIGTPLALSSSIPRPSSSARRSFARPPPSRGTSAHRSVDVDVNSLADQMAQIFDMNSHMYHHTSC